MSRSQPNRRLPRHTGRIVLAAMLLSALAFLFVLPGRTWLQQRDAMSVANHRLQVLTQENRDLARQASQLQNPAYIEQLARQQYGLTLPGEKAYGILPPTATTTTTTVAPPVTTKG